jgi:hypothetical protein
VTIGCAAWHGAVAVLPMALIAFRPANSVSVIWVVVAGVAAVVFLLGGLRFVECTS